MAERERPTCSSQEGISPANKQGNSSDSSTPSKGEEEETPRPTKKNKRKMSAPRKRTDVSSKRFCLADKVTELYGDDDDDDMMDDVKQLTPHTPEPSPSSDERNNSVESGASPSPVLVPPVVPPHLLGSVVPSLYQTPVITSVGGVPRYTLFPGLPPGFFPAPGLVPPGFVPMMPGAARLPSPTQDDRSMNPGLNTSHSSSKEASPSSCPTSVPSPSPSVCSGLDADSMSGSRKQRKNYKNMTRERRIEANARERTRVHTISAAFESLRRAVPSYSYHQRLSKLAILRIACSYIMSLSRLADTEYSDDQNDLSFAECVDLCTQTIQSEGRAKRRQ